MSHITSYGKGRAVTFLSANNVIQALKDEMLAYMTKATESPLILTHWPWWRIFALELSSWASVAQKFVLLKPSSAPAKTVFLPLSTMFTDQQHDALEDYTRGGIDATS